jgi:hypothetical protein
MSLLTLSVLHFSIVFMQANVHSVVPATMNPVLATMSTICYAFGLLKR